MVRACPSNWNDAGAWDRFFSSFDPSAPWSGALDLFILLDLPDWLTRLRDEGYHKIWLPGCGTSFVPWILAADGFHVWASDFSTKAIEVQHTDAFVGCLTRLLDKRSREFKSASDASVCARIADNLRRSACHVRFSVHDSRERFPESGFDLVMDVQAYSGLHFISKRRAARTFCAALRPGGMAHIHVLNQPVERRRALEAPLDEAGFSVIGAADTWYQLAVRDRWEIRMHWFLPPEKLLREKAQERWIFWRHRYRRQLQELEKLKQEHRRRREQEDAERKRLGDTAKYAEIVYNTG